MIPAKKQAPLQPERIAFGRAEWEQITSLPLTSADEMVTLGLIRSLKIGRRRIFLFADVKTMFEKLAARGETLQPRQLHNARRAAEASAQKKTSQRARRGKVVA
jgi:hypothetical protein